MLHKFFEEYKNNLDGVQNVSLAVNVDNKSAIAAYLKFGFKIEFKISFLRILRINLPYVTV